MKRHLGKSIPALLCAPVIVLIFGAQWLIQTTDQPPFLHKLEWMTYDWRVRVALNYSAPVATNLGFVNINDDALEEVASNRLGVEADLLWPRHVYGRLIQELDGQGAEAIALDVLFKGYRSTNETAKLPDGQVIGSDHYFALQLSSAGNVILGAQQGALPAPLFLKTARAVGDITAIKDRDGVLRRVKAFEDLMDWHPLILQAHRRRDGFEFDTNRVIFPDTNGRRIEIPIDPEGNFNQAQLYEPLMAFLGDPQKAPAGVDPISKAYRRYRAWNLGLTLAAFHLKLDLKNAMIEPGIRILLRASDGTERTIPIDRQNRLLIDWRITSENTTLYREPFDAVLAQYKLRAEGRTNDLRDLWRGKLILVGSTASGNNLTDRGATPIEADTFLTSGLWNIANSLLVGRFIRQTPLAINFLIIVSFALIAARVTWKSRTLAASLVVVLLGAAYAGLALSAYVHSRYWLPMVLPLTALVVTHFALLTYRVVFEQRERRRIRNVFSRMVSPNIVSELLKVEKLSMEGTRREVTVFFSDVRGFTALTDKSHARAEEHIRRHKLPGPEAQAYSDAQAQEVLATVNRYLSVIADQVHAHEGTLDKYIGDCVMAFWGAPTSIPKHAVRCVRAAIDAQRAIAALNDERAAENHRREEENTARASRGEEPWPMLDPLFMGSGINTGIVNIGLMGSEKNSTYTVFGREVNLASRLEGLSGRGRIVISESTFRALQRDDAALAATCPELPPAELKGFSGTVKVYEVPWKAAEDAESFTAIPVASTTPVTPAGSPTR